MKERYSTIEAVFQNSLIQYLDTIDFSVNGTQCSLRYLPNYPEFESATSLDILMLGKTIVVDFFDVSFLQLHEDTKAVENYASLPKPLQQALAEYIFENTLSTFSRAIETPLSFLDRVQENSQHTVKVAFMFSFEDCECPLAFTVPQECVQHFITRLLSLPPKQNDVSHISLLCAVGVGDMELRLEELHDLEEGDVLIPDSVSHISSNPHALLYAVGCSELNDFPAFYCTLEKNTLTIMQPYSFKQENTMNDEQNQIDNAQTAGQEAAPAPVMNFNDIKVKLSFELEKRTMTVKELQELHEGTQIVLDSDPMQPVTVVVGDSPFAKARIVDIDGRYGLQLTKILVNKD